MKIAIIGAGISGLSIASMVKDTHEVTVFEKSEKVGGLVKCDRVNNNLFHKVGGHVFNSKNKAVLDWFWGQFDVDKEFLKAKRNAKILMNGKVIGYPLENFLSDLPSNVVSDIIDDLLSLNASKVPSDYDNFAQFLEGNFGKTLYRIYFEPYNNKIWNTDLSTVPLEWLEGKLPMPNLKEMLLNNIVKKEEGDMVHSTFFYAKENGSQFIADRLSKGLNIVLNTPVNEIKRQGQYYRINGSEGFDKVVYTGDIRRLSGIMSAQNADFDADLRSIVGVKSNGTSNIFCETDVTDISWLYLPEDNIKAHRIIYTGTFSEHNNLGSDRMTCVVEFSGRHEYSFMVEEIKKLPGNLRPLHYNYEPNSYVIQNAETRDKVQKIKEILEPQGFYLLGRFAEWEYYNMDKAIEAAMEVNNMIRKNG